MQMFEIWGQSNLKVIQAFHTERIVLYIEFSGPEIGSLTALIAYIYILDYWYNALG